MSPSPRTCSARWPRRWSAGPDPTTGPVACAEPERTPAEVDARWDRTLDAGRRPIRTDPKSRWLLVGVTLAPHLAFLLTSRRPSPSTLDDAVVPHGSAPEPPKGAGLVMVRSRRATRLGWRATGPVAARPAAALPNARSDARSTSPPAGSLLHREGRAGQTAVMMMIGSSPGGRPGVTGGRGRPATAGTAGPARRAPATRGWRHGC